MYEDDIPQCVFYQVINMYSFSTPKQGCCVKSIDDERYIRSEVVCGHVHATKGERDECDDGSERMVWI